MKPMPQGSCPTCDKLWREYAHAAAEHVKVLMENRRAVKRRDKSSDDKFAVAIANARQKRELARVEIRQHEANAHDDSASGRTAGS
jgi:hypothetical protein